MQPSDFDNYFPAPSNHDLDDIVDDDPDVAHNDQPEFEVQDDWPDNLSEDDPEEVAASTEISLCVTCGAVCTSCAKFE